MQRLLRTTHHLQIVTLAIQRRCEMISACFGASCGRELKYLRDGRVIRMIRNEHGGVRAEHFWLCGLVTSNMTLLPIVIKVRAWRRPSVTGPIRNPELRWIVKQIAS